MRVFSLILAAFFVLSIPASAQRSQDFGKKEWQQVMDFILDKFENEANDSIDLRECLFKILDRGVHGCDPYAGFFTEDEMEVFFISMGSAYSGIGAQILNRNGYVILIPYVGSPAMAAGVLPGDTLIAVDSVRIDKDISLDNVARLIRGPKGTPVSLKFFRGGTGKIITVERQEVHLPSLAYDTISADIGYIKIILFGDNLVSDFSEALDSLLAVGIKGIVLDVRDNPGGSLSAVKDLLDINFSPQLRVPMISLTHRGNVRRVDFTDRVGRVRSIPAVVLVNEFSASASEIFAGVLQGWGVPIVGDTTFGKGSVQTFFPGPGFFFKLTTHEYCVGASCVKIDGIGVLPDSVVEDARVVDLSSTPAPAGKLVFNVRADKQLRAALDILRRKIN